jgi:hypothetical protein
VAAPEVVVVAEMPSLGSSIFELLVAGGIDAVKVAGLRDAVWRLHQSGVGPPRVFVCATANRRCQFAAEWAGGPFSRVPLVVVGSRDLTLPQAELIQFVTLPLSPTVLLNLVRGLVRQDVRGAGRGP